MERHCQGTLQRTPFVFEPISFPNAGADLLCLATQSPIGLKRSASCWPRRGAKLKKKQQQHTMENALADLAQVLRERIAIIHDDESRRNADAHIARLRAVSERIEDLQTALPQPVDPRLAHYLQRRSYEKALEFLENS
jgi:formate dehydrogenase maturation protein FdhE